jgi:hypothetical protein
LVERVKERKLLLGTCLEEGSFLGLVGDKARVALSQEHAFHRAMLELKENRAIVNEELEQSFGRGASLICEAAPPRPESRRPMSVPADAPRVSGTGDAGPAPGRGDAPPAAGTGMVQRIVELFDGEILNPGPEGNGA